MNGINALIKRLPRVPSSLSTMWGDVKKLGVSNLEEALTRTWLCWHLDLGLPDSRTMRNKFTQVHGTLLTSLNSLRQGFWSTGLTHSNILGRISQMVGQLEGCKWAPGRPWERTPFPRTAGQVLSSWATSLKAPRRAATGHGVRWHAHGPEGTQENNAPHLRPCHLALGLGSQPQSLQLLPVNEGPVRCWRTLCSVCPEKARGGGEGLRAGSAQPQLHLHWTFHCDFGWQAFESSKLTEEASL